jgi:CMP-N-acetylneuraminic acid synthetase
MKVLWLLVGRGGSKGVPGKNTRVIRGHTLVDWKLAAVPQDAVVAVSSDDPGIRAEALRCRPGAIEIVRPAELATDTATTASVVRHALGVVGGEYDAVMLLEPSAPFTRSATYLEALRMMEERDADLVVGVRPAEPHPVFVGEERDDSSVTGIILGFQRMARRRQDFKPCVTMSGGCYLFRVGMFLETGDVYGGVRNFGVKQGRWDGVEIDSMDDLALAEWAAETGRVRYGC